MSTAANTRLKMAKIHDHMAVHVEKVSQRKVYPCAYLSLQPHFF